MPQDDNSALGNPQPGVPGTAPPPQDTRAPEGPRPAAAVAESPAATSAPPNERPAEPARPLGARLRKHWARFAAIALIALGGVGAVGHFLGGLAGWWEFFHLTGKLAGDRGAHTDASQSKARTAAALSIVVLPFANEGDVEDTWFADSLSADIAQAARMLAEHMKQQPGFNAERIVAILRGDQPDFVAARRQLVDTLREIGLK